MKTQPRFIKAIVEASAKADTPLPWTRGARRAAFIAKRKGLIAPRKSA